MSDTNDFFFFKVALTIIEGYFINALFNVNLEFAGKFFKYLAMLLSHRIRERRK